MKKSTHNGTCQVCGRLQALPEGRIAKHGYTVKHNYFIGVCPGARHAPLETERALADEVAAGLIVDAIEAEGKLARVHAGELLPAYADAGFRTRDRSGNRIDVEVRFADATVWMQRHAVESLARSLESRAKLARTISAEITARADKITGKQELQARAE